MDELRFKGSIGDMFDEIVQAYPNQEAIVTEKVRINYKEFSEKVDWLAKGLVQLGIQKNDKVAVWLANCPEWLYSYFAITKIGAVSVPINTRYKSVELEYILRQSDTSALIMMDNFLKIDFLEMITEICPELERDSHSPLESSRLPNLKSVILVGNRNLGASISFTEVLKMGRNGKNGMARSCDPEDVAVIVYTSGTTGEPKGAMLTHRSIVNNGYNCGEIQQLKIDDRMLIHVPLFSAFGCVNATIAATTHGCPIVLTPHFNPEVSIRTIDRERITCVYSVPSMLVMMLEEPSLKHHNLNSLRTGVIGGSPLAEELCRKAIHELGISEITVGYGLTECSAICTQSRIGDSTELLTGTVGRPMPGVARYRREKQVRYVFVDSM